MKVSELEGTKLDYWVAQVLGVAGTKVMRSAITGSKITHKTEWCEDDYPAYSTAWAAGGPVIERGHIAIMPYGGGWSASVLEEGLVFNPEITESVEGTGKTALIAAMRALVASKFGDEVPA